MKMRFALLLLFCSFLPQLQAQTLNEGSKAAVVQQIGKTLTETYVLEDVAQKAANHLNQLLADGAYAPITDPKLFAKRLTDDLYTILHDKHVRVRSRPPLADKVEDGNRSDAVMLDLWKRRQGTREYNKGIQSAQVLAGNIGYLEVTGFPVMEDLKAHVDSAFQLLANVDALILDLRRNHGGSPTGVQYLCSYLLPPDVHINSLHYRGEAEDRVFRTLKDLPGTRLVDVPLYVLTSSETFSGGEECAYNLQTQKRATLIGETTGGGANPGGTLPLPFGFSIFVPNGMAINPITKTNWEGVGVVPELACPREDALTQALARAKDGAEAYAKKCEAEAQEYYNRLTGQLRQLPADVSGAELTAFCDTLQQGCAKGYLDEGQLNAMGYALLKENPQWAISLFLANTKLFPLSSNTYDSYGEALAAQGKAEQAIAAYKKAIRIAETNGDQEMVSLHRQGLARVDK